MPLTGRKLKGLVSADTQERWVLRPRNSWRWHRLYLVLAQYLHFSLDMSLVSYRFPHCPLRTALLRVRPFDWDHSRGWEQSARAELGHGAVLERSCPWTPRQLLGGFPRLCWGRGWAEQRSSMQPRTATNTLTAIPPEHGSVQRN